MRVLQLHSRYREYGGEERVVDNDATLLRAAGHEVLTHEVPNPSGGLAAAASLAASSWNLRQARRVRRLVEDWRPDVAHVHNTWFSLSPAVIRAIKDSGAPLVLTLHNYRLSCASANHFRLGSPCFDCLGASQAKGVARGCYRSSSPLSGAVALSVGMNDRVGTWRLPDVVTVLSERQAELVRRSGRIDPDRLEVVPNWTPDPGPPASRPSRSNEVVFAGRTAPEKGLDRLVAAWRSASGGLGDLKLRIFCPTEIRPEPDWKHLGIVVSSGVGNDVPGALADSRAVVVPSLWEEPFGMVAIEAFAAGRPAIGTAIGALPETIGRLDPACLFGPDEEEDWVEALVRLDDDEWVDRLGERARVLFGNRFGPSRGLESLLGVYGKAIEVSGSLSEAA